jgi:type IV secretion system protein VirB3
MAMTGHSTFAGFEVPLYRALTEPILLAGAPRTLAIVNGTLAAALGLGLRLWIVGLLVWVIGHALAAAAARKDAQFAEVISRHARTPGAFSC